MLLNTQLSLGFLLSSSLNVLSVHCQTPPGYSLTTSNTVNVTFGGSHQIYTGEFILPQEAFSVPTLSSTQLDPFEPHIAFMIDLEIIKQGITYPLLHWYQADLWSSPQTSSSPLLNATNTGAPYVGPMPIPGAKHTYVVLLFRQPLDYKFPTCFNDIFPISLETRSGFDIHLFMKMAGLENLVAANYFYSQNPESLPTATSLKSPECAKATEIGDVFSDAGMRVDL